MNLKIERNLVAARCFSGCRNIKSVTCEYCGYRIDGAFVGENNIEEISFCRVGVMPELYGCQALKKLNIYGSFSGELTRSIPRTKNLQEINIEDNEDYVTVDGVVFTSDWKLLFYPPQKKRQEIYCSRKD